MSLGETRVKRNTTRSPGAANKHFLDEQRMEL
jgi:hypothetical protein